MRSNEYPVQIPAQQSVRAPAQTRRIRFSFLLLLLFCVSALFAAAPARAKGKPLAWKVIDDALLRVNGSAVKDWSTSQSGKKSDPLLLKTGNRFLLVEIRDRRVFEIDPKTVEEKADELLWSPSERPTRPLATSAWTTEDLGSAFRIAFKLDAEDRSFDLQLPHPPDVGDLPSRAPRSNTNRRR